VSGTASTITRMSEEGLLITLSAVRMSVKNAIIVKALRERANFSDVDYTAIARAELIALSKRSIHDAERVEKQRKRLAKFKGTYSYDDDMRQDVKLLSQRRKVYHQLAASLLEVSDDEERISEIVTGAQMDATAEIVGALSARFVEQAKLAEDPEYQTKRLDRMRDLVAIDLALLADSVTPTY
jgi:hypothetical protein